MTRFLDILRLFAFNSASVLKAFLDIFKICFSPPSHIGHAGSCLSTSRVVASKHSAWYTCPHGSTATTGRSLVLMILWLLHTDFSVKNFEQAPQVCRSEEGEHENLLLHPLIFPKPEPKCSLSKDHLPLCEEATSSEKVLMDHPSEDPPWDPTVKSWLQVESTNDDLPSDKEQLFGDFNPRILLSETCLNNRCPGERRARLDGVELGGCG